MSRLTSKEPERGGARTRLLEAARDIIRQKGFASTSVDDLCQAAGVTKGAYFHHFKSKEDLGVAAARFWIEETEAAFASAPYSQAPDPLARILAYLDFRKSAIVGDIAEWTCLLGTMTQELYVSHPAIRDACAEGILGHAATLERDIAAAVELHGLDIDWTPESLAQHIQAVMQGSFILAKASGDARLAVDSIEHLGTYIKFLFSLGRRQKSS